MTEVPDVEAYLGAVLVGIGAVRVWAYTSGTRIHHILESTSVQVEVRAASRTSAEDRAHEARARILALPGRVWHDGVVASVDQVMGPAWLPDSDGAPRYVFRCTINYRANRTT